MNERREGRGIRGYPEGMALIKTFILGFLLYSDMRGTKILVLAILFIPRVKISTSPVSVLKKAGGKHEERRFKAEIPI